MGQEHQESVDSENDIENFPWQPLGDLFEILFVLTLFESSREYLIMNQCRLEFYSNCNPGHSLMSY
jgi:hypothetical protein